MTDEFCPRCGTRQEPGASRCPACGLVLDALPDVRAAADGPREAHPTEPDGQTAATVALTDAGRDRVPVSPTAAVPASQPPSAADSTRIGGSRGQIIAYREGLAVATKNGGRLFPWELVADVEWVVGPLRVPYVVVVLADGSPLPNGLALASSDRSVAMPWGAAGRQDFERLRAAIPAARAGAAAPAPSEFVAGLPSGTAAGAGQVASPATPPAFCTSCGAPRSGAGNFCASCGHPFDPALPAAPPAATGSQADARPSMASLVQPPTSVEPVLPRIRTSIPGFVRDQLQPSEQVLGAFSASLFDHRRRHELRHDKFVLTTERIISYHTGMVHKEFGEMPYRTLTAVRYNGGVIHGEVVVEAASAGMTISRIGTDDAKFCERVIAARMAGRVLGPV